MDAPEVRPDRDPRVGSRVVVRHRLEQPDPLTGATLTDAVGELVAHDDGILVVRTRRGEVRVRRAAVTAVKEIPPSPSRRGKPHRALSVEDMQRVMVGAWPAVETARLGDWVLRASRGFTQRANSVMTAGSPGIALPDALDRVERWYAERDLPPNLTLAGPVGFDPTDDQVGAEALRRGYLPRVATLTLTAPTRLLADLRHGKGPGGAPEVADPQPVEVGGELTDAWFTAYRAYREVDDEAARAILTGSPAQAFATVRDGDGGGDDVAGGGGAVIGIGRLGLSAAWGGIAAMWVDPRARRRGIATGMLAALARAAERAGAASLHLQTDTDNTTALALYEGHGFERHHSYVNLRRPGG
ncbi:MAG TPA: GNAT family N-acetyltransferase [Ornithinibacter sp.]|nr:GNAT family N-acetyltransferase [Ornithinibacter sp.]